MKKCWWRKRKFKLWAQDRVQAAKASWEGRKEMPFPFCRSDTPASPLWEKVTRSREQDLAKTLCIILLHWVVPGRSERRRWMDSPDGWGWTENNNSVAPWIRCSLFGTTSKAAIGRLCLRVSSRSSWEVLLFSKIDRKPLIMCLQLHCGLTKMRWTFLQLSCVLRVGGKAWGMC